MSTLSIINEFPVLRHKLDLGEYHSDLKGNEVEVWLNLSDDFQEQWRIFNAGIKAQAENEAIANAAALDELFADLWNEIRSNEVDYLRQHWGEYAEHVSELAREQSEAPLTDELKQVRAGLWAALWNLDIADTVILFDKMEAAGLRNWMRRRTWDLIEEYATRRGEAAGG